MAWLLVLIGLILGIVVIADPIKRLAVKLSFESMSGSSWKAGLLSIVVLPSSAAPQDVIRDLYSSNRSYKIIEAEKIIILDPVLSNHYYGALVEDSDRRRRTLIFWYEQGKFSGKPFDGREGCWMVKNFVAN